MLALPEASRAGEADASGPEGERKEQRACDSRCPAAAVAEHMGTHVCELVSAPTMLS